MTERKLGKLRLRLATRASIQYQLSGKTCLGFVIYILTASSTCLIEANQNEDALAEHHDADEQQQPRLVDSGPPVVLVPAGERRVSGSASASNTLNRQAT